MRMQKPVNILVHHLSSAFSRATEALTAIDGSEAAFYSFGKIIGGYELVGM
jgi:hypothetical protein